jgi:AraC-like DNA-binding protein
MYAEWTDVLAAGVLWSRQVATGLAGLDRILPDGCLDLIWTDGELIVAGPDTRAQVGPSQPGAVCGVRFHSGRGPAVLGVPADELRDARVPLAALWPGDEVRRLTELVSDAPDRPRALADVVRGRLARTPPPDALALEVCRRLHAGHSVAATAAAVGLGARQLHRRSLPAFGYGPKTLARILRLQKAVGLARAGGPFADVSVAAGYADQAHLSRDVKALAGVPLRELIR